MNIFPDDSSNCDLYLRDCFSGFSIECSILDHYIFEGKCAVHYALWDRMGLAYIENTNLEIALGNEAGHSFEFRFETPITWTEPSRLTWEWSMILNRQFLFSYNTLTKRQLSNDIFRRMVHLSFEIQPKLTGTQFLSSTEEQSVISSKQLFNLSTTSLPLKSWLSNIQPWRVRSEGAFETIPRTGMLGECQTW